MREATCWRALELAFEGAGGYRNPYLDVQVEVIFTGPQGAKILRPAFSDGGRMWRVRFAPTQPGLWRYVVRSAQEAVLDGAQGELLAAEADGEAAVHRRGFLRRSHDGHHLEHADGTPFFWLGDTHWRFTAEQWDAANKPGWRSWFRGTVDKRVAQGFTVYQANLMLFDWGADYSSYFLPGRLFVEPDLAFFREVVDLRMAYLAERGLVVALGLGWHQAVDAQLDGVRRFAREIVARYGAYPVVWTLGGEVAGYEPELRQHRVDRWREVARIIQATDAYDHPRTAHATNERPIAPYYQGEDWLTLTLNQHGHGDQDISTAHYGDYFAAHPGTPLVEGESLYEGLTSVEYAGRRTVTDAMVRHVAYRAFQSGCCGYSYGAQGCWNGAAESADHATGWGDLPWYEGIDLPGGEQMGHLRRFYEGLPWSELRPTLCFSSGSGINDAFYPPDVTADASRSTVVLFFSETYRRGDGQAHVSRLQDVPYTVRWFDPRTGATHHALTALPIGGRLEVPDKPDDRDWLLVLQATPPATTRERTCPMTPTTRPARRTLDEFTVAADALANPEARALLRTEAPGLLDSPQADQFSAFPLGGFLRFVLGADAERANRLLVALAEIENTAPPRDEPPAIEPDREYEDQSVPRGSARLELPTFGEVHRMSELKLMGPSHGNPFVDVDLAAEFRLGDLHLTVGGFYDGDGRYCIRFLPPEAGKWRFMTESSARRRPGPFFTRRIDDNTRPHSPDTCCDEHAKPPSHSLGELGGRGGVPVAEGEKLPACTVYPPLAAPNSMARSVAFSSVSGYVYWKKRPFH